VRCWIVLYWSIEREAKFGTIDRHTIIDSNRLHVRIARENAQSIYGGFENAGYRGRPCLVRSKIETLTTELTRISLHTCVSNCKYENVACYTCT
jgi:hypothetical protein